MLSQHSPCVGCWLLYLCQWWRKWQKEKNLDRVWEIRQEVSPTPGLLAGQDTPFCLLSRAPILQAFCALAFCCTQPWARGSSACWNACLLQALTDFLHVWLPALIKKKKAKSEHIMAFKPQKTDRFLLHPWGRGLRTVKTRQTKTGLLFNEPG